MTSVRLSQRTDNFVSRVDQATESLLSRFSAIVELSALSPSATDPRGRREDDDGGTTRTAVSTAAATALQVENHANQMVKAAEELRTIIREVRECWVLGTRPEHDQSNNDDLEEEQRDYLNKSITSAILHSTAATTTTNT